MSNTLSEYLVNKATVDLQHMLNTAAIKKRVVIVLVNCDITPGMLIEKVAEVLGYTVAEMTRRTRKNNYVESRQICMLMLRQYFKNIALKEIARLLNLSDHSSVMSGIERANNLIYTKDAVFYSNYLHVAKEVEKWLKS